MEDALRKLKVEYKEHYDTVRGTINDTFKNWIKKFNLKVCFLSSKFLQLIKSSPISSVCTLILLKHFAGVIGLRP